MSITDFDETLPERKRARSESLSLSRDALNLVAPFNKQVGAWQAEAARLVAKAQRARVSGRRDPGIEEAVTTLLAYISERSARFEEAVAAAPESVATHSRVADTRTALSMVAQRLREASHRHKVGHGLGQLAGPGSRR